MREQLTELRRVMKQSGIDVYIIPTDDFHGSEYVGEYFRCRAYVSGFTGSAGTLAVTQEWAGLWTDGRYFLQAAQQLEGSGIYLMKMGQPHVPTLAEWLDVTLTENMTLGFDGRSMTSGSGAVYEKLAAKHGARIVYDYDLVGEIWADRPAMSEAPVWELSEKYAGRSRRDKLNALKSDVQEAGADTFILTSLDDLAWLLNIRGDDVACCPVVLGDLVMQKDSIRLYTDEKKYPAELKEKLEADGITFRPYLSLYGDVKQLPQDSTILLDPDKLNYALRRNLPKTAKIIESASPTELPKAVKTQAEQDNMRLAHIRDGVALTRFMKWLKEHVGKDEITEISAAEKLEGFRKEMEHYIEPSFSPIVGFAEHGAIIHYGATPETDAALKPEGLVLADTGGHYLEGTTDVTRTFVLGPLTDDMKYHYTLVLRSHLDLAMAVFRSGTSGMNLDYTARKPFWDVGLDYNHGTGHGVGYLLSVHEGPQGIRYYQSAGRKEYTPLEPGMITSDEPGIYLEGRYGIRLENLTLCVDKGTNEYGTFYGFELLTMCPFELEAINVDELSDAQKQFLNAYHQRVYDNLAPYFDDEEKAWLKLATRAI